MQVAGIEVEEEVADPLFGNDPVWAALQRDIRRRERAERAERN